MQQVLFRIPLRIPGWIPDGIPIYGFGMMLFVAFVLCTWLASRRAAQEGIRKEILQDLAIWLFVGGILGARLTFLLVEGESIWQILRIWDSGLVLYGSVIGGVVAYLFAYFILIRRNHVSTLKLADVIAPSVAAGICVGRIGCFLNGCCFGSVACPDCMSVSFPLSGPPRYALTRDGYQTAAGFTLRENASDDRTVESVDPSSPAEASGLKTGDVIIKAAAVPTTSAADERAISRFEDLQDFMTRQWPRGKNRLTLEVKRGDQELTIGPFAPRTLALHPTQLYESISMALVFLLLTAYYPFRKNPGEVMALLMFCYGLQRYFNEMLRNDPRPVGFERYVSLFLVAVGLLGWIWLRVRPQVPSQSAPATPAKLAIGGRAN